MRIIAPALEWWIKKQGKFEGATICTKEIMLYDEHSGAELSGTGTFEITEWKVDGIDQPDEASIDSIYEDYEADLLIQQADKQERRDALVNKFLLLGLTQDEIKEFIK